MDKRVSDELLEEREFYVPQKARVYSFVHQDSGMRKGLLAAKARLWKEGFTITRLELISANKAANDVDNVRSTLEGFM